MAAKRRQHSAEPQFRVALAAVREVNTVSELASQHWESVAAAWPEKRA